MKFFTLLLLTFCAIQYTYSQNDQNESLDEILIISSNIELPFSKNSKSITVITSQDIKKSTATSVTDLLQNVAGIDVRRRGQKGTQSDLYIRGGSFEQTLILIDGIKSEDPQTGHHTMNMMIPLENIERIEIIKGAASRVYGQNAFNGVINIVTKKNHSQKAMVSHTLGSYNSKSIDANAGLNLKNSNHFVSFSHADSDGYRANSDFKNENYFLKSTFNTQKQPIDLIASLGERKFGAQYFYTSPQSNFNEYEETLTSLVGVSTRYQIDDNIIIKPKLFWKRNQDEFLLKRDNPSFSRNFTISNKIGASVNSSYKSTIGTTGIGMDASNVWMNSNSLGDRKRTQLSAFVEHRFSLIKERLDITPGLSLNHYSDFGFQAFPGIDLGYKASDKTRLYYNIGRTYRVPTYTELYISIPNFLSGNANLQPETAISQELGIKYKVKSLSVNAATYYRESKNLIDYIKLTSTSPVFKAENLRQINTFGVELNANYDFTLAKQTQSIHIGYNFMNDDYQMVNVFKSRYLINTSMKHQITATLSTQFFKTISQHFSYRYVERPLNNYHVLDAKVNAKIKSFTLFAIANNILNTEYFEKEFIIMPKSNFEFGISYRFE